MWQPDWFSVQNASHWALTDQKPTHDYGAPSQETHSILYILRSNTNSYFGAIVHIVASV